MAFYAKQYFKGKALLSSTDENAGNCQEALVSDTQLVAQTHKSFNRVKRVCYALNIDQVMTRKLNLNHSNRQRR